MQGGAGEQSRVEELREEYGMSRACTAADVLAERLVHLIDDLYNSVIRDGLDLAQSRNAAAETMAQEAAAILLGGC